MAADSLLKVVFEHEGVFIHLAGGGGGPDALVSGCLRVVDKESEVLVEFRPEDTDSMLCAGKDSSSVMEGDQVSEQKALLDSQSYETDWDMVHAVTARRKSPAEGSLTPCREKSRGAFSLAVGDLRSISVKEEGWTFLVLKLKESCSSPPALHFHQGGSREFLDCLGRFALLSQTLSQSFENLLDDNNYGLVQKFRKDPYVTTLGGFSKVTNYIFDAFRVTEEQLRPPEEAELLGEVIPGLDINQQEEPGFEVITRIDLGARPEVTRAAPLSSEAWSQHQDPEGRMTDVPLLKQVIFKGGLCHALRKEAWKFLLGCVPWDSTLEDRKLLQRTRTDEYFRMKLQWKSVSEEQERRNSRLRDYRSLIGERLTPPAVEAGPRPRVHAHALTARPLSSEKDVNRTDRSNRFYEGPDNPGLVLLHDILMTYCMWDFDLGYVQGMSDLLSPILYVMENEVDAFWCFVSFMDQMHQNFEEQMQGMKTQLIQLSTLLRLLDLSFWNYLESQDSGFLYFCFRWLLIRFKRELSFQDVLRLWEVMWTGLPCDNFHLLICCAILDSEKKKIMEENYGFNEILKHINELSMKLDIEDILQKAEGICEQITSHKDLPQSISGILGPDLGLDFEVCDCAASPSLRTPQRPDACSNGLSTGGGAPHGCRVAFIS
ncbi:TBC1 domain family member 15 [Liparis tanakae]|uniref:TBC1 domain family member 15 n=1 Tax=Liparis tanakae TaxID=230148 RepID=A0A4Z2H1J8_9TELE|nr:TBC1 domain family member 15 [Liparis tanakae]